MTFFSQLLHSLTCARWWVVGSGQQCAVESEEKKKKRHMRQVKTKPCDLDQRKTRFKVISLQQSFKFSFSRNILLF
jgi:hypothetical protein